MGRFFIEKNFNHQKGYHKLQNQKLYCITAVAIGRLQLSSLFKGALYCLYTISSLVNLMCVLKYRPISYV